MSGIEKPTPIERFVQVLPLSYPLACLTWVIILGPIAYGLADLQSGASLPYVANPLNPFLGGLLLFYVLYIVRYVRLRVFAAEPTVTQIMPGGEMAYRSIFGRVNNTQSILVLTIFLEALAFLSTLPTRTVSLISALDVITQIILILAFATLIWEYSTASWGLHKLGSSHLNLKSFLEDRFMGAKTIGNVELSLTVAYLGGLALFFLDTTTFLPVLTPPFEIFYLVLLALGVILFFLPLNSLHDKMRAEKAEYQKELTSQFIAINQSLPTSSSDGPNPQSLEKSVIKLVKLKDLEMTERKLANTPTWPFDIQLLGKLITIVLSITAVLLSRIITNFLKI